MRTKLALAFVFVLAGCSSAPSEDTPSVVSLQTPGSAPVSVAPAAPVIRPDTTAAEVRRMQQPWMKCLKENKVPMRTAEDGLLDISASGNTNETNGRIIAETDRKVVAACGKLKPVLAPELDEDKNPYWADDDNNYHLCLVAAGQDFVKRNGEWRPGPTWYTDPQEPDEALELRCQAEAFDGKKG
ncbi:hypothetical protein M1L60_26195 [Actinoplanes sp. TRM 88003]|uniref:Uncharacterized protein n=1 Tax=Paractinoplanes aksuensis TaxID=2939490 RepID=A0ABT1DTC0_9ACTN|nr:hypothetical protein [Actinoplanes aksuensis]MCO8274096.1 hypothetical protein [Actinoplanes aksuensis]